MNNSQDKIQSYVSLPQSLVSFIRKSLEHWLIKDREARYIFVNDPAFEFFKFRLGMGHQYSGNKHDVIAGIDNILNTIK